jgi:hypothetical protein
MSYLPNHQSPESPFGPWLFKSPFSSHSRTIPDVALLNRIESKNSQTHYPAWIQDRFHQYAQNPKLYLCLEL